MAGGCKESGRLVCWIYEAPQPGTPPPPLVAYRKHCVMHTVLAGWQEEARSVAEEIVMAAASEAAEAAHREADLERQLRADAEERLVGAEHDVRYSCNSRLCSQPPSA